MPTWVSVLIAIASGLGSGGFAAWLTARNDRKDRFRHRLIEAADEFASAASVALVKTRDAITDEGAEGKGADIAWAERDAVLHRCARVDLLFGPGRDTSRRANDVIHELANVGLLLISPSPDPRAALGAHLQAAEALRGFNLAAAEAIRKAEPPVVAREDQKRHRLTKRTRFRLQR